MWPGPLGLAGSPIQILEQENEKQSLIFLIHAFNIVKCGGTVLRNTDLLYFHYLLRASTTDLHVLNDGDTKPI